MSAATPAVYESFGQTIERVKARTSRAIFVIITDGLENFADADRIGIRPDRMAKIKKDIIFQSYQAFGDVVSDFREGKEQVKDWDEKMKGKTKDDDVPY